MNGPDGAPAIRICVVCTANMCRSPMASAMLRAALEERGAKAEVLSAGTAVEAIAQRAGVTGGLEASRSTVRVMAELDFDLSTHRATHATAEHLAGFDLILVMAREHVRQIAVLDPALLRRTFVLKHFVELGEQAPLRSRDPLERIRELDSRRGDPRAVRYRGPDLDVEDPVGGPYPLFLAARQEIRDHVRRAVDILLGDARVNENLRRNDPEIAELCHDELRRLSTCLQLIPSENFPSVAVMEAQGSVFTVKYAEGYPGRRYYGGYQVVDRLEPVVIERARSLFGAEHANVQPHAGAIANMCV